MEKESQIHGFTDYLSTQNLSPNTVRAYLAAIRQYFSLYPELNHQIGRASCRERV